MKEKKGIELEGLDEAIQILWFILIMSLFILVTFLYKYHENTQDRIDNLEVKIEELQEQADYNAYRIDDVEDEMIEAFNDELPIWLEENYPILSEVVEEQESYSQEELEFIIETLLKDMVDFKYDDTVDIYFYEDTNVFTITQYNQHGEVFKTTAYTINDIIEELTSEVD